MSCAPWLLFAAHRGLHHAEQSSTYADNRFWATSVVADFIFRDRFGVEAVEI